MVQGLYSILDRVADELSPPSAFKNEAVAARWFRTAMDSRPAGADPRDYSLVFLGVFDNETGDITPADVRAVIDVGMATARNVEDSLGESTIHKE